MSIIYICAKLRLSRRCASPVSWIIPLPSYPEYQSLLCDWSYDSRYRFTKAETKRLSAIHSSFLFLPMCIDICFVRAVLKSRTPAWRHNSRRSFFYITCSRLYISLFEKNLMSAFVFGFRCLSIFTIFRLIIWQFYYNTWGDSWSVILHTNYLLGWLFCHTCFWYLVLKQYKI